MPLAADYRHRTRPLGAAHDENMKSDGGENLAVGERLFP
jgi:hypothetical protein